MAEQDLAALQAQVASANARIAEMEAQVRGVAQERDDYREQARQAAAYRAPVATLPASGGTPGNPFAVLPQYVEGFNPQAVDQYYDGRYVAQAQYQRDLQAAVQQAYQLARGDLYVLRGIDAARSQYPDLAKWDAPMTKKTLDILLKERYATPRYDQWQRPLPVNSWEDLTYTEVNAVSRAARMAQAEMTLEREAAAKATADAHAAQGAAGVAGGGAPAGPGGSGTTAEDWDKAAAADDLNQIGKLLEAHMTQGT